MAKLGQTKRVVLIEFVLVLISGFIIAYMLLPDTVPSAEPPSRQLVATPVPDQSRTLPDVPAAKPAPSEVAALAKVTVQRKIEPHNKAPAPVSVPVVETGSLDNSELATVAKQVLTAIPEPKMALEIKPTVPPVTQTVQVPAPMKVVPPASEAKAVLEVKPAELPVNQPEQDHVPMQVLVAVPEPKTALQVKPAELPVTQNAQVTVPKKVLPQIPETKAALAFIPTEPTDNAPEPVTDQNILPAQKLLPAESQAKSSASDSEKSSARVMIAGTVAAVVFAPIAVPASIIFGFAAGLFTPTASQLGQTKPIPTNRKHGKQPENTSDY